MATDNHRSSRILLATMGVMGYLRSLVLILVCVAVTACATRPDEAPAIRTIEPMEAVDPWAANVLAGRSGGDDGVHSVLALSAGGADGAYGAGVLVGWSRSGTRPEFDVVTGVSTGALMAVFAFLGEPYDKILQDVYTNTSNADIFRDRGLAGLFSESLYDNTPLKEQIELFVDEELLERVAAQHRLGRRLYVATTNLDGGAVAIWDMGDIAIGGRTDKVLHFQKVLRASAAVPGFFDPVYIKPQRGIQLRQAHVDGGVKEPILVTDFMMESPLRDKRLYMIINGNVKRFNDTRPVRANVADISRKAITELLRELTEETIYRDYILARSTNARFHLTAIPPSIPETENSLEFNTARMKQLFDAGLKAGQAGPDTWLKEPERLGKFER